MKLPELKSPTKAQIEASNDHKREKAVRADIHKIDALTDVDDQTQILELHRYLDGKYQCCIADWGKSMWGYIDGIGFAYDGLDTDSLKENLAMMKPKLEAFMHGWNTAKQPARYTPPTTPDVNVTVNNNVTVNITFEQVRAKIEDMTSLTDEQTKEALDKVSEIESVVKGDGSKKSKWEKIKPILTWLAGKSFDVAISVYDFKRAVEDGATVPLYYENRGEKLGTIKNPEISQEIIDAIENADLDVSQQEKLELEFAKEIHVLTAEPRLDAIARDFVEHYTAVWTSGKAMFVCLNKVTCVRMYNLAQKYWEQKIAETEAALKKTTSQQAYQELERKLQWLKETEMAVVISQEQNEIQTFKKWGLDILSHRAKMEKRELDKEFKDSANPFRIVFVCAMWLTGFDVKSLSCLYLDKPLKAHTLMQTIARANRVSEGKSNGLIVDYIGIVKALRKALADYTANVGGQNGGDPTVDKEQLIARIAELIAQTDVFLENLGFSLSELVAAKDFAKQARIKTGADAVCGSMEDKKEFQTYASELVRVMKYLQRDDLTENQLQYRDAIVAIYKELQMKRKHADNTDLMVEINQIISENLTLEPSSGEEDSKQFDISKIDFDLLRREFAKAAHKRLIIKDLADLVEERIKQMLARNPGRMDYYDRYQAIIKEYNDEKDRAAIAKAFEDLMNLSQDLTQEEKRYVREGFSSDEELSMFDLLFKENLSKQEIAMIKKVSVDLLAKVKAKIAELDHWADKPETKAIVDNLIRDTLWAELPESYDEISITSYRKEIYEYIYLRYKSAA